MILHGTISFITFPLQIFAKTQLENGNFLLKPVNAADSATRERVDGRD